jgi:Translation initiation factor IF-2, N-terminal region
MSRRVYEVARELGLSTKEVMGRLNEAGVEAKSNLSGVDDPAYERVFGGAPNGRPAAGEAKVLPRGVGRAPTSTRGRSRRESRVLGVLARVLVLVLAFAVSVGLGAVAALVF